MSGGKWADGWGGQEQAGGGGSSAKPPGWDAGRGAPPAGDDRDDVIDVYCDDSPIPEHWTGQPAALQRIDGVSVAVGVQAFADAPDGAVAGPDAPVGWNVTLPLPGGRSEVVFIEAPTARVALRVVDTCWPPPAYIVMPQGWLVDLERMRATRLELVAPLGFEDWQEGWRTTLGLHVTLANDGYLALASPSFDPATESADTYAVAVGRGAFDRLRLEPDLTHPETVAGLLAVDLVRRVGVPPYAAVTPSEVPL